MPLDPPDTETSVSEHRRAMQDDIGEATARLERSNEPKHIAMCGATKKFKIASTLEVTLPCKYVQHTALVEHFAEDWIDGVHVQFRWPE